mmetsp:Transcript_702/g.1863  ORF Transcript_702/g.1863 Transcript_702/m.1863 type:complete len:172 (+) Transcript_702:22-537(+)
MRGFLPALARTASLIGARRAASKGALAKRWLTRLSVAAVQLTNFLAPSVSDAAAALPTSPRLLEGTSVTALEWQLLGANCGNDGLLHRRRLTAGDRSTLVRLETLRSGLALRDNGVGRDIDEGTPTAVSEGVPVVWLETLRSGLALRDNGAGWRIDASPPAAIREDVPLVW